MPLIHHILSSVSQSNVGCFMVGPPILGCAIACIHSACASAMAWMATLVTSATALVIASLIICSVAIICLNLLVLFYFLYLSAITTFSLLTPCCSIMPYYDDNTMYMLSYYIYYLHIAKLVQIITSTSAYIHTMPSTVNP